MHFLENKTIVSSSELVLVTDRDVLYRLPPPHIVLKNDFTQNSAEKQKELILWSSLLDHGPVMWFKW